MSSAPVPVPAWLQGRLRPEPAASRIVYNTFFKYSPTYMTTIMITATFAGLGFDYFMNSLWDFNNKGVSRAAGHARPVVVFGGYGCWFGVREVKLTLRGKSRDAAAS